jgi:hypothetical protein
MNMDNVTYDIIVVGGGSAGWMSASTLIKEFPDKKIALIESPEIATVGVGESTLGQIRNWLNYLDIKDRDFLNYVDGTYKLSIQFTDFYKKDEYFHYPLGMPDGMETTNNGYNDWWYKKFIYPETPYTDYVDCFFSQMALVNSNKLSINDDKQLNNFQFFKDSAFHFDAVKFGLWLRNNYCLPRGLVHIKEHITDIKQNEDGIESLNEKYKANLYIDCTGFASILLGKTLKVPFESYSDMLPNNSAWATKLPYKDKRKELVNYTDCKAVENGWIWKIPLWSRVGTGYVYSDNFIDDDSALKQFQKHLGTDEAEFKKIKMKIGIHERLWEKNVVALGLSSGFIEPLESNGLYSVHEFLRELIRELKRDRISQWDRDNFTYSCKSLFKEFAEFVSLHYILSHRNDTQYWKHIQEKSQLHEGHPFMSRIAEQRGLGNNRGYFGRLGGIHTIATGMHYSPVTLHEVMWGLDQSKESFEREWEPYIEKLNTKRNKWNHAVKNYENTYDFLQRNIYG